jgi:hypothetical protein
MSPGPGGVAADFVDMGDMRQQGNAFEKSRKKPQGKAYDERVLMVLIHQWILPASGLSPGPIATGILGGPPRRIVILRAPVHGICGNDPSLKSSERSRWTLSRGLRCLIPGTGELVLRSIHPRPGSLLCYFPPAVLSIVLPSFCPKHGLLKGMDDGALA